MMSPSRRPIWRRPAVLLRFAAFAVVGFHVLAFGLWSPGADAAIYYRAEMDDLYTGSIFTETFNYSPAFAWWTQPLQGLPFEAFRTLVVAIDMVGLVFLIGPVFTAVVLLAQLLPIWMEFQLGNLNFAIAAALVLGFRHTGWYAAPILSKVTPGIGLVWFAARRDWRALTLAAAITLAVALPSLLLHLDAWLEFIASLLSNAALDAQIGAPLILRVALAVAVVSWGAWTDRPWTVPVGAALVAHVNGNGWLIALGAVRLLREGRARPPGDELEQPHEQVAGNPVRRDRDPGEAEPAAPPEPGTERNADR